MIETGYAEHLINAFDKIIKASGSITRTEDMNYKEIGKTLGITEGNVKVRVFRAREALAKLLGEDDVYLS